MAIARPRKTNQGAHPSSTNQSQQTRMYTPNKLLGHASVLMADALAQPNTQPNSSQDPAVKHGACLITDMIALSPICLLHHSITRNAGDLNTFTSTLPPMPQWSTQLAEACRSHVCRVLMGIHGWACKFKAHAHTNTHVRSPASRQVLLARGNSKTHNPQNRTSRQDLLTMVEMSLRQEHVS